MFKNLSRKVRIAIISSICSVLVAAGLVGAAFLGAGLSKDGFGEKKPLAEINYTNVTVTDLNSMVNTWKTLKSNSAVKFTLTGNVRSTNGSFGTGTNFGEQGALIVPSGANIIIDLNGYEINAGRTSAIQEGCVFVNNGTLTIQDSNPNSSHTYTVLGTDYTVKGGVIGGGYNTHNGGGIINNGTLTIEKGTLFNNKAGTTALGAYGGGIYNSAEGILNVKGGTFYKNVSQGVQLNSAGEILIASYGGGAVYSEGTFNLTGGTFEANSAGSSGGAINYAGSENFKISGATFKSNTATYGGALHLKGTATITSGTFTDNTADYAGGAIYLYSKSTLTVNAMTATGNSAGQNVPFDSSSYGGGAIRSWNSTVNLFGSVVSGAPSILIKSNKATYGGAINASDSSTVTIRNANTNAANNIKLGDPANNNFNVTSDTICVRIEDNHCVSAQNFMACGGGIYQYSGTLNLGKGSALIANGGKAIGTYLADKEQGGGFYLNNVTTTFSGALLDRNFASWYGHGRFIGGTTTIKDGTTFSNGWANVRIVHISSHTTFNGCNFFHNGYKNGNHSDTALTDDIMRQDGYTLTITNVKWRYNRAAANYVSYKESGDMHIGTVGASDDNIIFENNIGKNAVNQIHGTLNANSGKFQNNSARVFQNGYYTDAILNIKGGTYTKNTINGSGGVVYNYQNGGTGYGTLNISGGTFSENQGTQGGVVFSQGKVTVTGGTFNNNTATEKGGAIFCQELTGIALNFDKFINVSGGSFTGNTAPYGGAIYVDSGINATFTGGTITGNKATSAYGGVYVNGNVNIGAAGKTSKPVVKDNLVGTAKSNFCPTGTIMVLGPWDGEAGSFGISKTGLVTSGYSGSNNGVSPSNFMFSDAGHKVATSGGEVIISSAADAQNLATPLVANTATIKFNQNKQVIFTNYNDGIVIKKIVRTRFTTNAIDTLSTAAADIITLYESGKTGNLADYINGSTVVATLAGQYTITVAPVSGKSWLNDDGTNGGTAEKTYTATIDKLTSQPSLTNRGDFPYNGGSYLNRFVGSPGNCLGITKFDVQFLKDGSSTIYTEAEARAGKDGYAINLGLYRKRYVPTWGTLNNEDARYDCYHAIGDIWFRVVKTTAEKLKFRVKNPTSVQYTGSQLTPAIEVYYSSSSKIIGTYENGKFTLASNNPDGALAISVAWGENKLPGTNAGTATVTVSSGTNFYAGSTSFSFDIYASSVPEGDFVGTKPTVTLVKNYDGTTSVKITGGDDFRYNGTKKLTYTGAYAYYDTADAGDNKKIYVIYQFTGADAELNGYNYVISVGAAINALNISSSTVTGISNVKYDGNAHNQAPTITMTVGGASTTLASGTDFTVTYTHSADGAGKTTNDGTVKVTITGKGNFTGTKEVSFTISKADIVASPVDNVYTYNGITHTVMNNSATPATGKQKVGLALTVQGSNTPTVKFIKQAAKPTDWSKAPSTLDVLNVADSGTVWYQVTAAHHNDLVGSFTLTINRQNVDNPVLVAADLTYNGEGQDLVTKFVADKMDLEVSFKAPGAESGTNLTSPSIKNANAGEYTLTFTPTANYKWANGTAAYVLKKEIAQKNLTAPTWANENGLIFNNKPQGATASYGASQGVVDGDTVTATLSYKGDGETEYNESANMPTNAGSYIATVKSVSSTNYKLTGTLTQAFSIGQFSLENATVTLPEGELVYNGAEQKKAPNVTVILVTGETATALTASDFTVAYSREGVEGSDVTNAGTVKVTVTGKGNYKDAATTEPTYEIKPRDIASEGVAVEVTSTHTYNGQAQTPTITVTDDEITITTADYSITAYDDNVNAGTVTATLTGAKNYTGTVDFEFDIDALDISAEDSSVAFDEIAAVTYNGKEQTPEFTVKFGETTLVLDVDFDTVTYADNLNAGTASVTISGIGNFTGDLTKQFTINRAALTLGTAKITNKDTIYAGQLLEVVTLDQTVTATYAAAEGVDDTVAGTWTWADGNDQKIVNALTDTSNKNFTAKYAAKFTPTDTTNFIIEGEEGAKVNEQEVSFPAVNLVITVYILQINTLGKVIDNKIAKFFIDYGTNYTIEDFKKTDSYVAVKGFTPYLAVADQEVPQVENVIKDTTVYVNFRASTDTKYYVFHLKQMFGATETAADLKYATLDDIIAVFDTKIVSVDGKITEINITDEDLFTLQSALKSRGIECEIKTGTTATAATYEAKEYAGFLFNSEQPSANINGDGTTYLLLTYARQSYKLTFSANGGKLDDTTTTKTEDYLYDAKIQDPNLTPSRTGYTFGGWYADFSGSEAKVTFGTDKMPASATTINAKWNAINYSLQFNYNELSDTLLHVDEKAPGYESGVTYSVDKEAFEPVKPTATGFTFLGWYYTKTNGDEVKISTINPTIIDNAKIEGNNTIAINAKWGKNSYLLTYNMNGGIGNIDAKYFKYGDEVTLAFEAAQQPTRTGYSFLGWNDYESATTKLDIFTMPAKDTTLYAVWEATEYYIDFTYGGHNAEQKQMITDVQTAFTDFYGSSLAKLKNTPYVSGKLDEELKVDFSKYSVQRDGQITLSRKPEYTGLKFKRWVYYKAMANGDKAATPTAITRFTDVILSNAYKNEYGHVEIFAEWAIPTYTVSFKNNTSTLSTRVTVTNLKDYSEYEAKFPAKPNRNGYEFVGWYTQPLTSDISLYEGYCIDYDGTYSIEENGGESIIGVPTRTQVVLDGNVTLYAGWKSVNYKMSLTAKDGETDISADLELTVNGGKPLDENGFETNIIEDIVVHTGDRLILNVTPAPGYRLVSLKVGDADCNSGSYSVSYGYTNNVIAIEAVVTPVIYRITYTSLEGGSWKQGATVPATFTVANYSADSSDTLLLPDNSDIERKGYTFLGWYMYGVDENGTPVIGKDRLNTAADFADYQDQIGDVQLIAKWEATTQTIYVYKNDENLTDYGECFTDDIHSNTNKTGDKVTIDIRLPDGYRLVGLSTTPNGRVVYSANLPTTAEYSTMSVDYIVRPDENKLYCHWVGKDDLYVLINPSVKDYKFQGTNGAPLTLTATPLTQYTETNREAVIYDFTWKKLNNDTTQFDTIKTERVTYDKNSPTSSNFTAKSTLDLRNRNDSGLYRCELVVTITTKLENGEVSVMMVYATNTSNIAGVVKPIGDYDCEVTIGQATVEGLSMKPATADYDGKDKKDLIKVLSNAGMVSEDGTKVNLLDGTQANINYVFTKEGSETPTTEVIDAGVYSVVANFEMPKDSNYEQINPIEVLLTINQKAITTVDYASNLSVSSEFTKAYDGTPLTVSASSKEILDRDKDFVTIELLNGSNKDIGDYFASVSKLGAGKLGDRSGNYVLQLGAEYTSKEYKVTLATRSELDELDFTDMLGKEGDARKTVIDYDGESHLLGLDLTGIEVPEEVKWTYTVNYTAHNGIYQDAGSSQIKIKGVTADFAEEGVSGIAAGTYVITVTFTDDDPNYSAKADLTTTLVINPATYEIDRTVKDEFGDNFDDLQYATYDPSATNKHHPLINDTTLAAAVKNGDISVEYTYERDMRQAGTTEANWQNISVHEGFGGAGSTGEYRLTATITFLSDAYVNNYAEIKPIVVTYIILPGEIDRLELHAYDDADGTGAALENGVITGKFNEQLDYTQFSLWVFYKANEGEEQKFEKVNASSYYIRDNMIASIGQAEGIQPEVEDLLGKFAMASDEYSVTFVYSTASLDYKIKVSPAEYTFAGVGIDKISGGKLTTQYSVEGYAPTVSFNATDVNGDKVDGISTVYSIYDEKTSAWGAWLTAEEVKTQLLAAGTYTVKFGYLHTDANYVGTTATAFKAVNETDDLTCTVEITAQSINEVIWQYNATGNEEDWTELTKGEDGKYKLPYIGKEYIFRALYATGVEDETQIATVSAGEGVSVLNAKNNYSLVATSEDGNYEISVSALTLEVTPVEVALSWFVGNDKYDANAKQLNYKAGNDNFTLINVKYTDVDGNEVVNGTDETATLKIGVKEMINAGDYELTVTNTDTNYKVTNETLTITVYGTTVSGATVQYKDAEGAWQDIPEGGLPYTGAKYAFQATYTTTEGEQTTTNVTVKETEDEILSAGTYTLEVGNIGNYYVEIAEGKDALVINKALLSVTFEEPTYDGTTQALGVTLNGLVGREASATQSDVIELSGDVEAKDVRAEDARYTITVTIKEEYFTNYTFASNYQSVDQSWNVKPRVVELTWAGPNGEVAKDGIISLSYTGRKQLPVATVTNLVNGDKITASYAPGEVDVTPQNSTYTATVLALIDGNDENSSESLNYTTSGASNITQQYVITKAQIDAKNANVKYNIRYTEYAIDNTTYTDTPLRNDKLVGDVFVMVNGRSVPIEGTFQFVDNDHGDYVLTTAGRISVGYEFIPTSKNFIGFNSQINITVQTLKPDRIEVVATKTAQTAYTAGERFKETGFDVYVIYNNFYVDENIVDETTGKLKEFGKKVKFVQDDINTQSPVYEIGGIDAESVTLTCAEGVDSTTIEVAVSLKYLYLAKPTDLTTSSATLGCTLDITVSRSKVVSITLNENKKPVYYVGEKFDVTQLALNVLYEGESVPKKETENIILVYPTGVFTQVGATSVTVRFGTQTLNIPIEVKEKEELPVVFTGRQLQYQNGTAIAIPTATFNGISLPNGVEVDENGKPLTVEDKLNGKGIGIIATYKIIDAPADATQLTALGKYTIQVSFVITNPRYKAHEAITAVFDVVEKVELAELTLVEGSNLELKTEGKAKYLTRVVAGATVAEVIGQFEETGGKIVVMKKGKEISGNALVGTGCTINLYDASVQPSDYATAKPVDTVAIVIKGDVNGDGKITNADKLSLFYIISGKMAAEGATKLASDVTGDNKITNADKLTLFYHIAGKKNLFA